MCADVMPWVPLHEQVLHHRVCCLGVVLRRDRLAVQLPDRVYIYELAHDDAYDMHYRIKDKIYEHLECNLLVVTSQHVILCLEKKLQLFNFQGRKEREWVLEAVIRYIKVRLGSFLGCRLRIQLVYDCCRSVRRITPSVSPPLPRSWADPRARRACSSV